MRQPLVAATFAAAAVLSLGACGQSNHSSASAPSTVKASSGSATSQSSSPSTATVTQTPPATVTHTVTPAPTVTQTETQAAPAGGGGTNGCSYEGKGIVLSNLSCGFAQNVVEAYENGESTAYSPATGGTYTFDCTTSSGVVYCTGDGTSTSIQHGGWLEW